jgi:hypothetical protein
MPAEHVSWFVKTGSVEQCEEAATDFTWRLVSLVTIHQPFWSASVLWQARLASHAYRYHECCNPCGQSWRWIDDQEPMTCRICAMRR